MDATGDGDIFCGQRFNSLKNDVIDGIVYRAFLPFRIYVITETAQSADGVTDIGFALKYYQVIAFYLHQYPLKINELIILFLILVTMWRT